MIAKVGKTNAAEGGDSGTTRVLVADVPLDLGDIRSAAGYVLQRARKKKPGYVCVANVHMFMEALDDPVFCSVMRQAVRVVPDGMPLAWLLRRIGMKGQPRIPGPDLMDVICRSAGKNGVSVGLVGGQTETLEDLKRNLMEKYPDLHIAYAFSPPFRELSTEEEEAIVRNCALSGAGVLFVGLGCPKQENWMARNSERFPGVMLGVGAAFDYHAGRLARAPSWMQRAGLEWLYRLAQEPRRLFRRYLDTNTRFVISVLLPAFVGGARVKVCNRQDFE